MLRANAEVQQAIKVLRIVTEDEKLEHGRSTPLVLDDEGKVIGLVDLIDLLRNVRHLCERPDVPCELDRATRPIKELTKTFGPSVGPDDTILAALDIMMDHGTSLVPVMKDGNLEGLIILSDVFNTVAGLLFDVENPLEREHLVRRFHL